MIEHSRSFDSNEISVMQFFSPLTVIVGHNGSGKTVSCTVLLWHKGGQVGESLEAESSRSSPEGSFHISA